MKQARFVVEIAILGSLVLSACATGTPVPSATEAPVAVATSVPATSAAPQQLIKVRMGISPFQDTLLPLVGVDKGWYAEEGLDVEMTTLAWNDIMTTLASGSIDLAVNNTAGVVSVVHQFPEAIFWYGWNIFDQASALMGNPASGLKTVKDFEAQGMSHEEALRATFLQLKGRTILTTMGTDMGKEVVAALSSVGLDYQKDATIIDMDPDQGLAAFLSGTGDAYLGGLAQRTRTEKEGMVVLASGAELAPPPINGFVTTEKYATENEDVMLKIQHVMFRIMRYCDANKEECGTFITDTLNSRTGSSMTVTDFTDFWQRLEHYDLNASEVQRDILSPEGYCYWKLTWDSDNKGLYEEQHVIPAPADYSHFWGDKVQELYVTKYGADETGY